MSSFTGDFDNFLPETFVLPEDPEQLRVKLYQYLNQIGSSINTKDSGLYDSRETLTGKKFLPTFSTTTSTNATYRDVYRVTIDTGVLVNGTKLIPHGITVDTSFSLVSLIGGASNPTAFTYIPMPFVDATTPLHLSMDTTNIIIIATGAVYPSYIRSFVVMEYIRVL